MWCPLPQTHIRYTPLHVHTYYLYTGTQLDTDDPLLRRQLSQTSVSMTRVTQIGLAPLGIFCSMRHLEVQIFVKSHGSVYTELLWCAEHGRWSDPEDSSATGVCEDKIRSLTFLGVVLARRSPVFSGPWFPLKSHGNACAPLSVFRTSFPVAFSRSLALPRAYEPTWGKVWGAAQL